MDSLPFPVPGGEYLPVPLPGEDCGGDWKPVVLHQPGVGGGGDQGAVVVDAGEAEESTNGVDMTISRVENGQAMC